MRTRLIVMVEHPDDITPERVNELVQTMIGVGQADAADTLEESEDNEDALHATQLNILCGIDTKER